MSNLPETEQRIIDVLTLHSPNWLINPDIAIQIGHMHNYTAKILSFLIKKGLVESRYVIHDGEKMNYKEYRLVSEKPQKTVKEGEGLNTMPVSGKGVLNEPTGGLESNLVDWRQVDIPCPVCGSYYQVKGKCNRCH